MSQPMPFWNTLLACVEGLPSSWSKLTRFTIGLCRVWGYKPKAKAKRAFANGPRSTRVRFLVCFVSRPRLSALKGSSSVLPNSPRGYRRFALEGKAEVCIKGGTASYTRLRTRVALRVDDTLPEKLPSPPFQYSHRSFKPVIKSGSEHIDLRCWVAFEAKFSDGVENDFNERRRKDGPLAKEFRYIQPPHSKLLVVSDRDEVFESRVDCREAYRARFENVYRVLFVKIRRRPF
ncbi:hypothetical protein BDM02DRAFT_3131733 [Thelephora ganbajun]|uniref:Uncharacterized protein n=1 Tax=Thelephora ganbajun TaxID=370292 RepID=A0ACB6Z3X9_THEGA|nr:hypothetical protein BDM02DRAFT_3131733 [Thelephora ganbajun]